MIIYGTAILAACHLLGEYFGNTLGQFLGVKANVGGVAIAMVLLIAAKEYLARKGLMPQPTRFGILYWSGLYIPIVVAMSAGQNVVSALSGGTAGILVAVASLAGTVYLIRVMNKSGHDSAYKWPSESETQ
ncbi:malonate transporter subunit MadL [Neisseria leonii]|uniref:malonate transporter subunit MadL n=1 Tax=Neisseria leonii TaxID=2995413 RepID=UPI00237A2CFE|nr:malonate transporter subunit MadL [Neisseria sp. 3986]MDD9326521.1 malonate transporter subunit MadL [Neisseria sp. 3986]